jgi:hypothetical protein
VQHRRISTRCIAIFTLRKFTETQADFRATSHLASRIDELITGCGGLVVAANSVEGDTVNILQSATSPKERIFMIGSEIAHRVIAAGEAKAKEIGQPMNIAVVDAGTNLKAFTRMDGAWLGSIDIADNKASPRGQIDEISTF